MYITVIIPTYRPGKYIYDCLNSLKEQTFDKSLYEIIIILNGCDEPWKSSLEEYIFTEMQSLNVKLLQISEGGVSNARNVGLDNAKGEYIAFLDDDDYVSKDYLSELYKCADKNTVVLSDAIAFFDETNDLDTSYGQHKLFSKMCDRKDLSITNVRKMFNGPCMKLIHRDIINNRKFEKKFKNGEDSLYMFLISDKIKNIRFTSPNAVYYRRFRTNSATTTKRSRFGIAMNGLNMSVYYTKYYLHNPLKYDFGFLISRYMGVLKTILLGR